VMLGSGLDDWLGNLPGSEDEASKIGGCNEGKTGEKAREI
jgi:hypothetical protein